ncbi:probable glycosyltransferase At3g07620 isoform X2 [Benincasa hispida]|uniref:probable glycosyltransferase At3g07620 isoform X2 n=1 Tax=Benincasa hispida TaxID=102211 RepID=UPI0019014AE2|nr:probable glycosyltransferase At3g07620 isoform X2 [Benincasa hispida]
MASIHICTNLFHGIKIQWLLIIMSIIIPILIVSQCYVYPYAKTSFLPLDVKSSNIMSLQNVTSLNHSEITGFKQVHFTDAIIRVKNKKESNDYVAEKKVERGFGLTSDGANNMLYEKGATFEEGLVMPNGNSTVVNDVRSGSVEFGYNPLKKEVILDNSYKRVAGGKDSNKLNMSEIRNNLSIVSNQSQELIVDPRKSDLSSAQNISSVPEDHFNKTEEIIKKDIRTEQGKNVSITLDGLAQYDISILKSLEMPSISISQMNALLSQSHNSSCLKLQCHWSSPRDRELLHARLEIEKATAIMNSPGIAASVFRNVSMFKRSYDLMEKLLKVYIYKEGEKPIFHQPRMRGIYASEGWFMKLIKENKKFVTRDPKKAHLFYLPFSSQLLRSAFSEQNSKNRNNLEEHLGNYVDLIRNKHQFWNRTGGADHFLVACHDWATKLTRNHMKNCIRALCNANAARGFQIGKDTSLPVTNIHLTKDPDITTGAKPPSERTTLAFFAGGMHGYLRPILLHFWGNREPDMKIFGPMPRDVEGKRAYREFMKNSKYCICARGYEVHTPRVVEAILNACVPVFISDNYVPPFFEVLNWESFSVFVQEKEISNLRNILLSVPEKDYLSMHARLKMVQKHFIWHKIPVKYDLFHMILHSVWYNRVFQMKTT